MHRKLLIVLMLALQGCTYGSMVVRCIFPSGCVEQVERHYCMSEGVNCWYQKENWSPEWRREVCNQVYGTEYPDTYKTGSRDDLERSWEQIETYDCPGVAYGTPKAPRESLKTFSPIK